MDRFGHLGYMAYFVILELLHKDGTGDYLRISGARLCQKLRSKRKVIEKYLVFSQESGKMVFTWKADDCHIQIKKFRERHQKMKSKLLATFHQPSTNLPQEGDKKEKEKKKQISAATPKPAVSKPKDLTSLQKVVRGFKEAKGVDSNDADWDRKFFARFTRPAKELLDAFNGDAEAAIAYTLTKSVEWEHLPDWGLEAVVKAAGREYNRIGGASGSEHIAVDANSLDGPGRSRRLTSAREVAGDTLRRIEQSKVHAEGPRELAGPSEDSGFYDEDVS